MYKKGFSYYLPPQLLSMAGKIDLSVSRRVANAKGRELFRDNKDLFKIDDENWKKVEELNTNGFAAFPEFFDSKLIDDVFKEVDQAYKDIKFNIGAFDGYDGTHINALNDRNNYEELKKNSNQFILNDPLYNIPSAHKLIFEPLIYKIVANYLGYLGSLMVNFRRSFPKDKPYASGHFHRDCNFYGVHDVVHAFIYLNDCEDEYTAPLIFVPKTHTFDVKSCSVKSNPEKCIRVCDSDMEKVYDQGTWLPLKGKKGTMAIANVIGWHKGPCWNEYGNPKNITRDVLTVSFIGKPNRKKGTVYQDEYKYRLDPHVYENLDPLIKLFMKYDNENIITNIDKF